MSRLARGAPRTGPAIFQRPIPFAAAPTPYPEWADALTEKATVR
jgi:hypothetical protein